MHTISSTHLSLERLKAILENHEKIKLSLESKAAIVKCREYLDHKMDHLDRPLYGISTGFGSLYNVNIPQSKGIVLSPSCSFNFSRP